MEGKALWKKWFIILVLTISVSLVTKIPASIAHAPGPDIMVTYNTETDESTITATDPDGIQEIATKREGETDWTNQPLGDQQGKTSVEIKVNGKVVEVRSKDNEATPHTSYYKKWEGVVAEKKVEYTIDKPYASTTVVAVIPGDNVKKPASPSDITKSSADSGTKTKLTFTPELKDPKVTDKEKNSVIIKVDPAGDLYIDEFPIIPLPIPIGYNTYWLIFTAIFLMLAGGYLIFRKRRKFAQK